MRSLGAILSFARRRVRVADGLGRVGKALEASRWSVHSVKLGRLLLRLSLCEYVLQSSPRHLGRVDQMRQELRSLDQSRSRAAEIRVGVDGVYAALADSSEIPPSGDLL